MAIFSMFDKISSKIKFRESMFWFKFSSFNFSRIWINDFFMGSLSWLPRGVSKQTKDVGKRTFFSGVGRQKIFWQKIRPQQRNDSLFARREALENCLNKKHSNTRSFSKFHQKWQIEGIEKFHRKRPIREMRKISSKTTYRFNEQTFSAKKKTFFVNPS